MMPISSRASQRSAAPASTLAAFRWCGPKVNDKEEPEGKGDPKQARQSI
jgi:hypothetical protein